MERLKLEKVYVKISKEDKPFFFFFLGGGVGGEGINMAAVLLFWHTNMAAVMIVSK